MPTVLLVDDSATDRRMIGGVLERNGFAVRYADNGSGALKQLHRSLPEAVLTRSWNGFSQLRLVDNAP